MCAIRKSYKDVPYYEGEPIELAMRDDVTYPPMRVWEDSLKYVCATVWGRLTGFRATKRQLDRIYSDMVSYARSHCQNDDELMAHLRGIDELWPSLKTKLMTNKGLVKYMNDVGSHSLSFARFPASLVPRAIALESAYGVNYDNAGIYRKLVPGCISMRCAAKENIFVDIRRRDYNIGQIIRRSVPELEKYKDVPSPTKLATIIDCGAGLLREFRKFGFTLAQIQSLEIIACDMDKEVMRHLDVVFMYDFGVPFKESGIDYRICKIEQLMADSKLRGKATVVLMDGVWSYCLDEEQLESYIRGACAWLLPTGGIITGDLQLMDVTLLRCAEVQCWESTMKPELTAGRAVRKIRRIADRLNLSMYHEVDPRNPHPIGVFFALYPRCNTLNR